jgi:hypothetical protein
MTVSQNPHMCVLTIYRAKKHITYIDDLVREGYELSRSDFIREAITEAIVRYNKFLHAQPTPTVPEPISTPMLQASELILGKYHVVHK